MSDFVERGRQLLEEPLAAGGALGRRVAYAALLMLATFVVGIVGYKVIGGPDHSWLDAVYMTANVITTAGFREAVDVRDDPAGEIFTIVLLVFGAATVVYFTSVVTAFVVEGDLTQGFRRRRMQRAIRTMEKHYVVCGASQTGIAVLRELVLTRREALVIEEDEAAVAALQAEFPEVPVLVADFTDDTALVAAGVGRAAGLVLCTDNDKDALVTTVLARQLNPRIRIVARASDERAAARIHHAGADSAISTSRIGGMRMASELVRPSVVSFLDQMLRDTNRNLRIEEVEIPRGSPLVGRRCGDLDLRAHGDLLLLAIRDADTGAYLYNPDAAHALEAGTQLIVMGDPQGMRALRKWAEGERGAVAASGLAT